MVLSKEQITFLDKINLPLDSDERVKDINTFFIYYCAIKEKLRSCNALFHGYIPSSIDIDPDFYKIKINDIIVGLSIGNKSIIFENSNETLTKVISFLELWDYLKKEKLIKVINKDPKDIEDFLVPVLEETEIAGVHDIYPIDKKLWQLVKDYVLLEIVPLPNLKEFRNRSLKNMDKKNNMGIIRKRKQIPRKKLQILQKEINSVCPFCSNEDVEHFVIHHIDKDRTNDDLSNLILLCRICHSKADVDDIPIPEVMEMKRKLSQGLIKSDNKQSSSVINVYGDTKNSLISGKTYVDKIIFKGKSKPKLSPHPDSIGSDLIKCNYVKYLIDRYQDCMKADKTKK